MFNPNLAPNSTPYYLDFLTSSNLQTGLSSLVDNDFIETMLPFVTGYIHGRERDYNSRNLFFDNSRRIVTDMGLPTYIGEEIKDTSNGVFNLTTAQQWMWFDTLLADPIKMHYDKTVNVDPFSEIQDKPKGTTSESRILQKGVYSSATYGVNQQGGNMLTDISQRLYAPMSPVRMEAIKDSVIERTQEHLMECFLSDLYYRTNSVDGGIVKKTYLDHSLTPTPLDYSAGFNIAKMKELCKLLSSKGNKYTKSTYWIAMVPQEVYDTYMEDAASQGNQTGGSVRSDNANTKRFNSAGLLTLDPFFHKVFLWNVPDSNVFRKDANGNYICPVFNVKGIDIKLFVSLHNCDIGVIDGQPRSDLQYHHIPFSAIPTIVEIRKTTSDKQYGYYTTFSTGMTLIKNRKENFAYFVSK